MLGTRGTEIYEADRTLALPEVTIWRESLTLTKGAETLMFVSVGCQHSKIHKDPSCAVPIVQMRKQTKTGAGTCSKSHSKEVAEPELEFRFLASGLNEFSHLDALMVYRPAPTG